MSIYRAWTGGGGGRRGQPHFDALGSCGLSMSGQEPLPLDLTQALHVGLFILPQAPPLMRARVRCPRECNVYTASCCPTLPCLLTVPCPRLPGHLALDLTNGTGRLERRGEGMERTKLPLLVPLVLLVLGVVTRTHS